MDPDSERLATTQERDKVRRDSRPMLIMIVSFVVALLLNGAFTVWSVQQSQHRWCSTVVALDDADAHAPKPTSQFGRNLVMDFHQLRIAFGCGLWQPTSPPCIT